MVTCTSLPNQCFIISFPFDATQDYFQFQDPGEASHGEKSAIQLVLTTAAQTLIGSRAP
jgi:hypothetical protein